MMAVQPATPNVETFLNTLQNLRDPDDAVTGNQINQFLYLLRRASDQHRIENPNAKRMIIFDKEVAYKNSTSRTNMMAQAHNATSSGQATENSKDMWKKEMQEWGHCQEAVFDCRATAINLFLVASSPNLVWERSWQYQFGGLANDPQARADHYDRLSNWHTYAIKIQDRCVWIYESSYQPRPASEASMPPRRLRKFAFMKRALDLINAYKGRNLRVDRILLGGGGNQSDRCQEMACQWLRGEVMGHLNLSGANHLVAVSNWEQIVL